MALYAENVHRRANGRKRTQNGNKQVKLYGTMGRMIKGMPFVSFATGHLLLRFAIRKKMERNWPVFAPSTGTVNRFNGCLCAESTWSRENSQVLLIWLNGNVNGKKCSRSNFNTIDRYAVCMHKHQHPFRRDVVRRSEAVCLPWFGRYWHLDFWPCLFSA